MFQHLSLMTRPERLKRRSHVDSRVGAPSRLFCGLAWGGENALGLAAASRVRFYRSSVRLFCGA